MSEDLFFGTSGPRDASIVICGESWGASEAQALRPFAGQSGDLLTSMLADAGIDRAQCFLTNVCSRRPEYNEMHRFFYSNAEAKSIGRLPARGLFPKEQTLKDVDRLHSQLFKVKPRVIVAVGNYALWALTRGDFRVVAGKENSAGYKVPAGIMDWRGSYCEYIEDSSIPVVPIIHPAATMREWTFRYPTVHDLRARVAPLSRGENAPRRPQRFILSPSLDTTLDVLGKLTSGELPGGAGRSSEGGAVQSGPLLLTIDLETSMHRIDCIGIGWSKEDALCIPFMTQGNDYGYWSPEDETQVVLSLQALFKSPHVNWSNQNILYDLQYLQQFLFCRPPVSHDTMVAHHLLWPGTPKDLGYLSSLYCEYHRYWGEASHYTYDDESRWRYNLIDCVRTWEITQELNLIIDKMGMRELFKERLKLLEISFKMTTRGVLIDKAERSRLTFEVMDEMCKVERGFEELFPPEVTALAAGKSAKSPWYRSPTQQAKLFYEVFGLPAVLHRKTKRPTMDDDALLKLATREPLFTSYVEDMQQLRSLGVYHNTFLTAPLDFDGRMRCSFNTSGTETFRWSSSENAFGTGTNLQNIPAGEENA